MKTRPSQQHKTNLTSQSIQVFLSSNIYFNLIRVAWVSRVKKDFLTLDIFHFFDNMISGQFLFVIAIVLPRLSTCHAGLFQGAKSATAEGLTSSDSIDKKVREI
jgi:hypothetical protein